MFAVVGTFILFVIYFEILIKGAVSYKSIVSKSCSFFVCFNCDVGYSEQK